MASEILPKLNRPIQDSLTGTFKAGVRKSGRARCTSWTGSAARRRGDRMSYRDRVSSPGPKKLLALDGGGIRGVITLEVLDRLESMLAEQLCAGEDFVLGDYFDYIAGTSTGAVIAAG